MQRSSGLTRVVVTGVSLQLDWKPARITDLIEHLRDVIWHQYNKLRRALCGLCEFQLSPAFTHHAVAQLWWSAVTEDVRERALEKLLKDNGLTVPDVGRRSGLWHLLTKSSLWPAVQGSPQERSTTATNRWADRQQALNAGQCYLGLFQTSVKL